MITKEQIPHVIGHTAYDQSHKKIGEVGQVFLDNETGEPEWLTVRTGMFGTKETFVPLRPTEVHGDEVMVPFKQEQIKEAPKVDIEGGELPASEEARLYEYYGLQYLPYEGRAAEPEVRPTPAEPEARPTPTARPTKVDQPPDESMTRSEEQLRVGKERRPAGRARLRKYVVTEEQQRTVPVRREEVRVEREPISEETRHRGGAGPEIQESEREVVLEEERPVVSKESVPVERVRLDKETVTEEETVGGEVRKERIQTEGIPEDEQ